MVMFIYIYLYHLKLQIVDL